MNAEAKNEEGGGGEFFYLDSAILKDKRIIESGICIGSFTYLTI